MASKTGVSSGLIGPLETGTHSIKEELKLIFNYIHMLKNPRLKTNATFTYG
ncbi:hypothetical protein [Desulfitispora alkaliphila]|uniref:hypothetical protein n=1 Tax=Desulfitispora alkaliphila TaxID=622674 RepID=UPI003D235D81